MENASKALIIAGAILISILLITIGIVLINSGRNITSQGTSQIASQEIQTFNAQFTPYEGTVKGSQVRALLATVRANNASNKAHKVGAWGQEQESKINNTKDYTVSLKYATTSFLDYGSELSYDYINLGAHTTEEGYIYKIEIRKTN